MDFTRRIDIDLPYDEAVTATKAALADQGFGTLTEIDLRQTLKDKLDVDIEPQVIIGACNPQIAHRAMDIDPRITALLPCNVIVRTSGNRTTIEASTRRSWRPCPTNRDWRRSQRMPPTASRPRSMPSRTAEAARGVRRMGGHHVDVR